MLVGFSLLLFCVIYLCRNLWLTVLGSGFETYCACIIALRFTRGTEDWNLAWRARARATFGRATFVEGSCEGFRRKFWYGFSGISGIFYGKWDYFFLSLLCVIVIVIVVVVVDQCRPCCDWFIL